MYNLTKQIVFRFLNFKKVKIGKNSKINNRTFFEGYNRIFNNTIVYSSFLGLGTYIANNSNIKSTKIGRFCAIGDNVRTCLGLHPTKDFISIHPAFFSAQKQAGFSFVTENLFDEHKYLDDAKKYVVEIGNDVWIGNNVIIMDGIIIGDGAIIAAGTIITKNVPAYAIVAGVPGKITKYRFDEETIAALLKIKWWNYSIKDLKKIAESFASKDEFFNKIKNIL